MSNTNPSDPSAPTPPADLQDLVYLEEMFHNLGYEDGVRDGIRAGRLDGQVFGATKSFEMGRELGFYYGIAEYWLEILNSQLPHHPTGTTTPPVPPSPPRKPTPATTTTTMTTTTTISTMSSPIRSNSTSNTPAAVMTTVKNPLRVIRHLKDVLALIEQFPTTNDRETDFIQTMDKIRTKFKLAMVPLGPVPTMSSETKSVSQTMSY
ncbi:hypothetical protein H4R33_003642 [Dimargaris cristalligena]|uniref:Uncharacterized protein n=1 Tax=Dimargaris cristalligena TaxID=215637 RepID=A0A4Q0A2Q8_9FUNG|nr:hypothetical protein H4R33_003642 [Dimargaris cristalligena]RKP39652.1 hypothetical protein BJ085DRAFT_38531 [Dimargaris cristalligena]|eukprot:RKP39652.1 hypothetical protein BJ085DRAFT_38531 [Dimargaris cristalligena]